MSKPCLPPELLGLIVESQPFSSTDLRHLCLVSKTMLHLARPLLYKEMSLWLQPDGRGEDDWPNNARDEVGRVLANDRLDEASTRLVRTLLASEAVASLPRRLSIHFLCRRRGFHVEQIVDALLPRLPNVSSLHLADFDMLQIENILAFVIKPQCNPSRMITTLELTPHEDWDDGAWRTEGAVVSALVALTSLTSLTVNGRLFGQVLRPSHVLPTFRLQELHVGRLRQNALGFLTASSRDSLRRLSIIQPTGHATLDFTHLTSLTDLHLNIKARPDPLTHAIVSSQLSGCTHLHSLTLSSVGSWIAFEEILIPSLPLLRSMYIISTDLATQDQWTPFSKRLAGDGTWCPKLEEVRVSVIHRWDRAELEEACEARRVRLVVDSVEHRDLDELFG
ncbi:hypothetical protein MNV49_006359 [Pseudohyphozyma bogoriensis]|nr:hypothetical protein MNV49_006359 [Pseudohyphozyma bogoriensis]